MKSRAKGTPSGTLAACSDTAKLRHAPAASDTSDTSGGDSEEGVERLLRAEYRDCASLDAAQDTCRVTPGARPGPAEPEPPHDTARVTRYHSARPGGGVPRLPAFGVAARGAQLPGQSSRRARTHGRYDVSPLWR